MHHQPHLALYELFSEPTRNSGNDDGCDPTDLMLAIRGLSSHDGQTDPRLAEGQPALSHLTSHEPTDEDDSLSAGCSTAETSSRA
jgi:hypothetical protein